MCSHPYEALHRCVDDNHFASWVDPGNYYYTLLYILSQPIQSVNRIQFHVSIIERR